MKLLDLLGTPSLEKFQLAIELNDDAMRTAANVASMLARTADDMLACGLVAGVIRDANGNAVGTWEFSEHHARRMPHQRTCPDCLSPGSRAAAGCS